MKLILEYHWGEEFVATGVETIPFEYSSDDFKLMVLEKIEELKNDFVSKYGIKDGSSGYRHAHITILGQEFMVDDLEDAIIIMYMNSMTGSNKIKQIH